MADLSKLREQIDQDLVKALVKRYDLSWKLAGLSGKRGRRSLTRKGKSGC